MALFVPSVAAQPIGISPLSATPVNPMQNHAPAQEQEIGQEAEKVGIQNIDISQRIQNQLDDAMAKQAETSFLQKAITITNGDDSNPGYLNTRGKVAIDGYKDAADALAQAKQEGMEDLTNDFQKSMYNRVASQHLLSFGKEMGDHRFQQTSQYSGETSINRANAYASSATVSSSSYGQVDADGQPTGDFARNLAVAEQETLNGVQVIKGAPADSEIAKSALMNVHTQIGTGALSQMMDARAPFSKVQSMYDDMKEKGWFDVRTMDTMGKMVKQYTEQEMTRSVVNQSLSDAVRKSQGQATTSTGTPDYQFAVKGATITSQFDPEQGNVQVAIPSGSSIQAPASGKVTQVGKDEDDNLTVKIQHPDGSETSFAGLTTANVKVGDSVNGGQNVATSGTIDGTAGLTWSLTDSKGAAVDPTRAGLAPVDLTKITDEKILGDALDRVRKQITDPVLQQQATSELEGMVRHNQQMANAAKSQTIQSASDAFYKGGMQWRSIPPTVFNSLPAEEQQHFKDLQTSKVLQNYEQGQQFRNMSETNLIARFLENPDQVTPENINQVRSQLSDSSYLTWMAKAEALKNSPRNVVEASDINTRMDYYAKHAGIKVDGQMTQTQKDELTDLKFSISQGIDQIKVQNKSKATDDQVNKYIQQQVTQHVLSVPRSAWNPLAFTGISPNRTVKPFTFQLPDGATHVVPGSDGKLHYTDGQRDLGVVQ